MKRKILIISYLFPPIGGGGVIRIKSLVERLKKDMDISVITTKENLYAEIYKEEEIKNIKIYKYLPFFAKVLQKETKNTFFNKKTNKNILWYIKRWVRYGLLIPDEKIFWIKRVLVSKREYIKDMDIIFATAPPYSNFLLGYFLAKIYRKPLILDYRDLWINNKTYPLFFPGNIIGRIMEYMWLKKAKFIIFTTEQQKKKMVEKYLFIENKTKVVYNGYDERIFDNMESEYLYKNGERKYMQIVYTGSLTPYRDPKMFFNALRKCINEGMKIKVKFIGYFDDKHKYLIEKYALKEYVKIENAKKQTEIAEILKKEADACLLIQSKKEGGDTAIPGKLFEYMAVKKPIIAIDDGGTVTDFAKGKEGIYLSDFKEEEIYENIKSIYFQYKIPKFDKIFSRKQMYEEIKGIIR